MFSSLSQSELDREYSPSSCVADINVYLEKYSRTSQGVKKNAVAQGSCIADLSYGRSEDERLDLFLPDTGSEVAVAGRSNAGKSSAINVIVNRRQFARTSKTPGRTQLVNFFSLRQGQHLVDLPGYGFARVSDAMRQHWAQLLQDYFESRECLNGLILVVDIRRQLTDFDRQMLDWLRYNGIPHTVVATKADKVKSSRRPARRKDLAAGCQLDPGDVVWVSAPKGDGINQLRSLVRTHLAS